jgi:cysteine-rich repeat protein
LKEPLMHARKPLSHIKLQNAHRTRPSKELTAVTCRVHWTWQKRLALAAIVLILVGAMGCSEENNQVETSAPACGDGVVDDGETCDQGTGNSDVLANACRTSCVLPSCGDGVLDNGEACDVGAENSDNTPNACHTDCTLSRCGDGVTDDGEECDQGSLNSDALTNACRTSCRLPGCGDGVLDNGEVCDDGDNNSDVTPNSCRTTCALPDCGDAVVDDGEECDDANEIDTDLCISCSAALCGDGVVHEGVEACDDGDLNSDAEPDACRSDCMPARCGDAVVDDGEECDDGGNEDGDGCTAQCRAETLRDSVGADYIRIPAGTFTMGSPESEPGRGGDETQREVTLSRPFWLQTYEVTQSEYETAIGTNPSNFAQCGENCPVENVTWFEAIAYANALSELEGLQSCYSEAGEVIGDPDGDLYECAGYRLPTESEWEYAARAGTTEAHYGDIDSIAWYLGNGGEETHAIGGKRPNAWGLYDMSGNVWEWAGDWYGGSIEYEPRDPVGPPGGEFRVIRGGSWRVDAPYHRSANTAGGRPDERYTDIGLRLARTIH